VLKEAEAGLPIKELVGKYGVTEQTYYRWKSKFGGMEVNDAKKLKALEDENRRLKAVRTDEPDSAKTIRCLLGPTGCKECTRKTRGFHKSLHDTC
jgi:putative transposase